MDQERGVRGEQEVNSQETEGIGFRCTPPFSKTTEPEAIHRLDSEF